MENKDNKNNKSNGIKDIFDTEDTTKDYSKKDIESGKGMGVLSYILPFIPYFVEKKNKFVMYHAKNGMNLLIIDIVYAIISSILMNTIKVSKSCWGFENCYKITPWWVEWPLNILSICLGIIALIGIINVCNGKAKELPIVNKIKIIK